MISLLDNKEYSSKIRFFRNMLYIRRVEERIASEYSKEEMRCPVHLSVGQEAVPVGVSALLKAEDHVVSAHRSHAHYLAKGGDLTAMLCEIFGKSGGCAKGKGGSMHLIDLEANVTAAVPIVGSSISIGTGIGFGLSLQGVESKVVVYFGDGATEEGVFAESLDFASLLHLPVLFVCENNCYSVYTPLEQRQSHDRDLQKICAGHGVKFFAGNGNNVEEVYDITKQAIDYMDDSIRPALIEFNTFRWLEHCGPNWDDHLNYRKKDELQMWMKNCPIERIRSSLSDFPEFSSCAENKIEGEIEDEINLAFKVARENTFPAENELYNDIYSDRQ